MIKWKKLLAAVLIVSCGVLCAEDFLEVVKHAEAHIKLQYDKESYAYKIAYDKIGKIYAMQVAEKQKIALIKEAFPKAFEEKPLIYLQPISWHIHSLALGYDIQESATSTRKVQDITKEIANIKSARNSSQQDTVRTNHNLTGGVSAGNDFSLNPFSWLSSLLNTKIKLSGSYAYGRNSSTQTAELWSKAQQNMFSQERTLITEIIQQTNVKNFHLSFSVTLTNNSSDSVVCDLSNAEIPILISGKSFNKYAKPVQKTNALRIMPQNSQIVSFRMELDNTTVRELVSYMSHSSPEIHFEQGNFPIYTNNGQVNIAIYPLTYPVKLNLPGFSGTWNIRRNHTNNGKLTTILESLQEISKDFEKTIGKTDIFTWQGGELTQVSGVAFGNFSDKDKAFRYIAFLQSGNNVYDQVDETLLKEKLPMGGYTIWVIDLNNLENYKNIHPDMQKLIYKNVKKAAEDGFLGLEKGNAAAQYRLGIMYYTGFWVKRDVVQSLKLFEKSFRQGNKLAQQAIIVLEKDPKKLFQLHLSAAKDGVVNSQYAIGKIYYHDKKNYKEAFMWFEKAAIKNHSQSQYNVGACYYNGQGTNQDIKLAKKWFEKAALQNDKDAQYMLGEIYKNGYIGNENIKEAIKWYRKAAINGHISSKVELGQCFDKINHPDQAMDWYLQAADGGDKRAYFFIGNYYYNKNDYKNAIDWYTKAAQFDHYEAQQKLNELRKNIAKNQIEKVITCRYEFYKILNEKGEKYKLNDFSNTNNEKLDLLGVFWQNYVGQIKNITEVNDCPSDFKDAFDSYIFASEKAEDLLKNHPPLMEAIDNFLMGFFFFTLFDTDDGYGKKVSDISKWKHKLKNVIDERKEAWERVQTVAIQYGVDISKFD